MPTEIDSCRRLRRLSPFLLAWHFPNRTPEWCGWDFPPGEGQTIIGNYYATRFKDAWEVAEYTATNLQSLENRTRAFANAFAPAPCLRRSKRRRALTSPRWRRPLASAPPMENFTVSRALMIIEAAASATARMCGIMRRPPHFCFPRMRGRCAKPHSVTAWTIQGGMRFRQLLPDGKERYHIAAADGQMGQIIHAYLDWKLSGDEAWLKTMWPRVKKAIEFAWIPGGWDANRDGVLDGVQHNTYDVEFYGPNPLCGIYYLGALRAAEEMGRAAGDDGSAE